MFDWTMYSKLTCLQINVDTILFCDRQFDFVFWHNPHCDWCDTRKCITPSLIDHKALPIPKRNFCPKYSSEETFSHVVFWAQYLRPVLYCFIKRDFHIVTYMYTNTYMYNAAMHNSNNTVIIAQFLPCYLTRDWQSWIEQDILHNCVHE